MIETPSPTLINRYLARRNFYAIESFHQNTLTLVFQQTFPKNLDLQHVLIKVILLNNL